MKAVAWLRLIADLITPYFFYCMIVWFLCAVYVAQELLRKACVALGPAGVCATSPPMSSPRTGGIALPQTACTTSSRTCPSTSPCSCYDAALPVPTGLPTISSPMGRSWTFDVTQQSDLAAEAEDALSETTDDACDLVDSDEESEPRDDSSDASGLSDAEDEYTEFMNNLERACRCRACANPSEESFVPPSLPSTRATSQ